MHEGNQANLTADKYRGEKNTSFQCIIFQNLAIHENMKSPGWGCFRQVIHHLFLSLSVFKCYLWRISFLIWGKHYLKHLKQEKHLSVNIADKQLPLSTLSSQAITPTQTYFHDNSLKYLSPNQTGSEITYYYITVNVVTFVSMGRAPHLLPAPTLLLTVLLRFCCVIRISSTKEVMFSPLFTTTQKLLNRFCWNIQDSLPVIQETID